jgi:phospholipase/carboxylesterase
VTPLSLVHRHREPTQPPASDARPPLLILLHGIDNNELHMAAVADRFDPRFVVLSVRSPIQLSEFGYGWFHVRLTPAPIANAEEAEVGWKHIARFIDEAVAEYDADPDRVYLAGFSQGGIMTLATLLTAPEKIAGGVSMSGRLLVEVLPHAAAPERLRDKHVLIIHGTSDARLGIDYAQRALEGLRRFPLIVDYEQLDIPHQMTDESVRLASEWLSRRLDDGLPSERHDVDVAED